MAWFVLVFTYLASSSEKEFTVQELSDGACGSTINDSMSCDIDAFTTPSPDDCICVFTRLGNG